MAVVLVVEDDTEVLKLMRTLITAEGHEVIGATTVAQAYAALEDEPDAIFVDVDMPDETGAQFVLKLRQHPTRAETPAMFVTAFPDRAWAVQRTGIAGAYLLEKPFRRQQILEALNLMLGSLRRRNLRVNLLPHLLSAEINGRSGLIVRNISQGGAYVLLENGPKLGESLTLKLTRNDDVLTTSANVAHAQAEGVGLAFDNPSPEFLTALGHLVDELLADGAPASERRRVERVRLSAAISWQRDGVPETAYLRDISPFGAYVVTASPPARGTTIYLYLAVDPAAENPEVVGSGAKIVRDGDDGFACSFVSPSPEFVLAVEQIIKVKPA